MRSARYRTLAALFFAAMLGLHALVAWNARFLLRKGYQDFTSFYAAGTMIREGLGRDLYNTRTQYRVQQPFASDVRIRLGPLPYNHPPFEALVFAPLSRLPYFPAYLVWVGTNLLILVLLPGLLRPYVPVLGKFPPLWWIAAELAFFPVFICLLQGQDSLFLLVFLALTWVALRNGRDFLAGCWLGLGLFRFQLVLLFLLICCLQRRRKALLGFAVLGLALVLVSVMVVGWREALHYPSYLWAMEKFIGGASPVVWVMPNLLGLLTTIGDGWSPAVLHTSVALLSVFLAAFCLTKWKAKATGNALDLGFSLSVVTTILVGFHVLVHDLSLLLLPLLLVFNWLEEADSVAGWRHTAIVAPMLVLLLSPLQLVLWFRWQRLSLMAVVLLFWIWGIAGGIAVKDPVEADPGRLPQSA